MYTKFFVCIFDQLCLFERVAIERKKHIASTFYLESWLAAIEELLRSSKTLRCSALFVPHTEVVGDFSWHWSRRNAGSESPPRHLLCLHVFWAVEWCNCCPSLKFHVISLKRYLGSFSWIYFILIRSNINSGTGLWWWWLWLPAFELFFSDCGLNNLSLARGKVTGGVLRLKSRCVSVRLHNSFLVLRPWRPTGTTSTLKRTFSAFLHVPPSRFSPRRENRTFFLLPILISRLLLFVWFYVLSANRVRWWQSKIFLFFSCGFMWHVDSARKNEKCTFERSRVNRFYLNQFIALRGVFFALPSSEEFLVARPGTSRWLDELWLGGPDRTSRKLIWNSFGTEN